MCALYSAVLLGGVDWCSLVYESAPCGCCSGWPLLLLTAGVDDFDDTSSYMMAWPPLCPASVGPGRLKVLELTVGGDTHPLVALVVLGVGAVQPVRVSMHL